MKTAVQRWLARVALSLVAIAPWGTGATAQSLSGKYGGDECLYELDFRGTDVVYVTTLGLSEARGRYTVEGDKVSVTAPGSPSVVFTRKGNALQTPFMGETMVCTKLAAVGAARPQVAPTAADRAATAYIRVAIDSHWVKGPDGWTTQQENSPYFRQFREITFTVEREQVSEAQRLNGTDYRGSVHFADTPFRHYGPVGSEGQYGWSDWQDSNPGTYLAVERRNGQWRFAWRLVDSHLFEGLKPDPARVPTGHDTLPAADPAGEHAESCDEYGPAYNTDNICYDTKPIPWGPTSILVPANAPVTPRPAILLLKVSREGQTLEARVYVPSNVATFNEAALDRARRLRWDPAQKDGEPIDAWLQWRFQPTRQAASR